MATPCKIRILRPLNGVYPLYQPTVGKEYPATLYPAQKGTNRKGRYSCAECVAIDMAGKKIIVRQDEYEMIEVLKPDNGGKADGEKICDDCGKSYDGGPLARYCPTCRKKRLSDYAKNRGFCYIGGAASAAKRRKESDGKT